MVLPTALLTRGPDDPGREKLSAVVTHDQHILAEKLRKLPRGQTLVGSQADRELPHDLNPDLLPIGPVRVNTLRDRKSVV